MRFRSRRDEQPHIDLVPFIDVLLVILIFLMLTTTYNRFTELQLTLPSAEADAARERPQELIVAISADGRYLVDHQPVSEPGVATIAQALRAAGTGDDTIVVISADAAASHQSVIRAMEAARDAGLSQITFVAQTSGGD